jgi:hypothetical protein
VDQFQTAQTKHQRIRDARHPEQGNLAAAEFSAAE